MTDMLNKGGYHDSCRRGCGGMDENMLLILLIILMCCGGFGGGCR